MTIFQHSSGLVRIGSVEILPLSMVAEPPSEARLAIDSMRQDRNYTLHKRPEEVPD
jgi:hypothetical protein